MNELPFKHLVFHHDGKSVGPKASGGPIGKAIQEFRSPNSIMPKIIDFKPIPAPDIEIDECLLTNHDQKYLYKMFCLVKDGYGYLATLGYDFESIQPGELSLARWLTTAGSHMRLYVSTLEPTEELERIVHIIMNLYCPTYFNIKQNYLIQDGAKNFCDAVQMARKCLNDEEWKIAKKVYERNSYHAHPEAILLGMICDEFHCEAAADLIIKARKYHCNDKNVRQYDMRKFKKYLNWSPVDYSHLINLRKLPPSLLTAPPILAPYSDEFLLEVAAGTKSLDLPKIPCHSQDVERAVADTTRASKAKIGLDKRHKYLLNLAKNRSIIGTEPKKSAFLPEIEISDNLDEFE